MPKKTNTIPVNPMIPGSEKGIFIRRMTSEDFHKYRQMDTFDIIRQAHRDEYHLFLLQEKGTTNIEIDFREHTAGPSSVIFIHPNQIHKTLSFTKAAISICAISNDNINPEYLKLLESISPADPLVLEKEIFSVISDAVSLCLKLSEQKEETLYDSLLQGSCNTLVGIIISQYLVQSKPLNRLSRFEIITKAFKELLEQNFVTAKSPAEYARQLNISPAYLNECIKNTTGQSVSHQIQQRVILEARRLLYHSDKSVKEIAMELGYDDYAYFSRLFTKVTGVTALTFRNKNRE